MPIIRIPYPNALPTVQQDYVDQNNLIETGFLRVNDPWPVVGGNIAQGAVFQCGGTVYLCTAATAIAGVASDYVQLTPAGGGATLTPSYVANLGGITWNETYNGYYDVGGNLYIFDEANALIDGEIAEEHLRFVTKNEDGDVAVGRNIHAGGNFAIDGDLDIDGDLTANGASNLLGDTNVAVNQATFPNMTDGQQVVNAGATWTPSAGLYMMVFTTNFLELQIFVNGSWRTANDAGPGLIWCDGANVRVNNLDVAGHTVYFLKLTA